MGSWRRDESQSPWLSPTDINSEPTLLDGGSRTICPTSILEDAFLGCRNKSGIMMLHDPECFSGLGSGGNVFTTPIQQVEIIDTASRIIIEKDHRPVIPEPISYSTIVRANPSKLPSYFDCPRCHWMEVRAGLESRNTMTNEDSQNWQEHSLSVDPATFGNVFHRIIEIGIGNPGPEQNGPSTPLPKSWTTRIEDRINNREIHQTAFRELLPPGADLQKVSEVTSTMSHRISDGKLGAMVRGLEVDGRKVEGLRTEMPFHISIPVEFEPVTRGKWTPDGEEVLISLDSTRVELSGS